MEYLNPLTMCFCETQEAKQLRRNEKRVTVPTPDFPFRDWAKLTQGLDTLDLRALPHAYYMALWDKYQRDYFRRQFNMT